MTTVAFDGTTIAVDTQTTSTGGAASMKDPNFIKGRIVDTVAGKVLLIVVGWVDDYFDAIPQIKEGKNPTLTEDESTIIMVKDGKVYTIEAESSPAAGEAPKRVPARVTEVRGPAAWGSGSPFAETVLRLQGTSTQAVATAITIDLYSGGKVLAWNVSDLRKLKGSNKLPTIAKEKS